MKTIERLDKAFETRAHTYCWDYKIVYAYPGLRAVVLAAAALATRAAEQSMNQGARYDGTLDDMNLALGKLDEHEND